ncbi:MAG TPA: membrane protein insertase YidC [Mycobacterium sp.]|nr:membrane protein insertase YidC [Mycobacterium sp.]
MGVIYYSISWLMLTWHTVWDTLGVGEWLATNWDWILSIVFLVITIRAILFPAFVKSIKSQRAMQALQPQLTEIRTKYKGDNQRIQQETMELMRAEKANPLMGCLPLLVQAPVLYGLYHVLRHLAKPDISPQYKTLYGWTVPLFNSASHARLFGAPIALSFRSNAAEAAHLGGTMTAVRVVAALLIVTMIITTFLTSRQMILKTGWATDPTQLMMQRLMMYGVPIGLLVSGLTFPIGVVIYWVTTNLFSLGQQFYVLRKFPPPANANGGGGTGFFGPTKPKTVNGKVVKTVQPTAKNKIKDTNDAPVQAKAVTGPKVGAKPVNPKKGNAAKR